MYTLTGKYHEDALLATGEVPPDEEPQHVVLGFQTDVGVTQRIELPEAVIACHPGSEHPDHLIVWTNGATMVFNYHSLNYILTKPCAIKEDNAKVSSKMNRRPA